MSLMHLNIHRRKLHCPDSESGVKNRRNLYLQNLALCLLHFYILLCRRHGQSGKYFITKKFLRDLFVAFGCALFLCLPRSLCGDCIEAKPRKVSRTRTTSMNVSDFVTINFQINGWRRLDTFQSAGERIVAFAFYHKSFDNFGSMSNTEPKHDHGSGESVPKTRSH